MFNDVARYKGLEAAVVIFWNGVDDCSRFPYEINVLNFVWINSHSLVFDHQIVAGVMIYNERIPTFDLGRQRRVTRTDLDNFIEFRQPEKKHIGSIHNTLLCFWTATALKLWQIGRTLAEQFETGCDN